MTNQRLEELLSAASDQPLDGDERTELDRLLDADPDARSTEAGYRHLDELLENTPDIEPPIELRDRIMRHAPFVRNPVVPARTTRLVPNAINAMLRYGFSAAFGALLVVAFYESQPPIARPTDITDLVGTMAPENPGQRRQLIDAWSLSDDGISSSARLEERNGFVVLQVRIDSARPVSIEIDLSAAGLGLEALSQQPGSLESIRFAHNVLQVEARGQRQFSVLLHGDKTGTTAAGQLAVTLVYTSNGKVVGQGLLKY